MTDQFTLDHLYADPALSEVVGKDYVLANFTPTEQQVICFCAQGMSNQEVADQLFMSLDTLKVHKRNIARKLGIKGQVAIRKFLVWAKKYG